MLNLRRSLSLILLFLTFLNSKTYGADKRVLCYFADWSEERNAEYRLFPKDVDASLCTHIVYAFAMPDLNDGIVPMDFLNTFTQSGSNEFLKLKMQNPDLKLFLSVGGWDQGSIRFSRLASDPVKRTWFAQYACKFIRSVSFDGLDVNWQWPGLREGSNSADKENYVLFLKEIKRYFVWEGMSTNRTRLELSVVLPPLRAVLTKGFDVNKILEEADYFNLLTMDYHTSTEPVINNHAPLYSLNEPDFNSELTVDTTVNMFLEINIDPRRMNLGIPMYGHTYLLESPISTTIGSRAEDEGMEGFGTRTPGLLAYYEICQYIKDNAWSVEYPNRTAMGPYAYHENDWVAYDDADIIKKKVQYANRKGLGGIMLWTIDQDDFNGNCNLRFPLTRAAREAIDEPTTSEATPFIPNPPLSAGAGGVDFYIALNNGTKPNNSFSSIQPLIQGQDNPANAQPPMVPQIALSQNIPLPTQTLSIESQPRPPVTIQPLVENRPPQPPSIFSPTQYIPQPVQPPNAPTYNSISCADNSCFFRDGWMLNNIFKTNHSFRLKLSKFQINKNNYFNQEPRHGVGSESAGG